MKLELTHLVCLSCSEIFPATFPLIGPRLCEACLFVENLSASSQDRYLNDLEADFET